MWPLPGDSLVQLDTLQTRTTGDTLWRVRVPVALFAPGALPVDPRSLLLVGPAGESLQVAFEPESVFVASVLPAAADSVPPADYKGLFAPPARIPLWVWGAVLAAALAAAALVVYLRRPRTQSAPPAKPSAPPWEIALSRLDELKAAGHHRRGEPRPFAIALSEILRRYLEDRYGFVALEQTTREIEASLVHVAIGEEQKETLLAALAGCDLAKYAKFHWPTPELDRALADARRFVDRTTPRPETDAVRAEAA